MHPLFQMRPPTITVDVGRVIGVDFGTVAYGVAWRELPSWERTIERVRATTLHKVHLERLLGQLRFQGAAVAYVEMNNGAPGSQWLRDLLADLDFACIPVSPDVTRPRLDEKKTAKGNARILAQSVGVTPRTSHEADAVAALLYGERLINLGLWEEVCYGMGL